MQRILVVGGNGFIGSAICRVAISRGLQVTSISSSGSPYRTPKGHTPDWTTKVVWHKGNALEPATYKHLLPGTTAVVHTLGTLLEDASYKKNLRIGNLFGFASSLLSGDRGNPLEQNVKTRYNVMNRDSALKMCDAFLATEATPDMTNPRAFVFLSAEDVFRPVVPARYIESKREAEDGIETMVAAQPSFRSVYLRPSLVYHPHYRPMTTPIAAVLDLAATLHSSAPAAVTTIASSLTHLSVGLGVVPTVRSIGNAITIPPIHVDHVAEAAVLAADPARADVRGAVGVFAMRELIGWKAKSSPVSSGRRARQTGVHAEGT